jgi:hypothetical protein
MKIIHELINLGKGKYGNGHTQIEVPDLLKIYDQREASTSTGGSGGGTTITTEGHIILDGNASIMTQQPNLRFNRMIVTNDNVNQQTIVTRPPSIILSTTPPLNPLQGDEWINSNTWKTYVYYDSYWVEQSRTGLGDQLFKPVLNSYNSQSVMITDQGNQLSNYLYYDGSSYWEYLGTTNGNISDYRKIGGSVTPGLGLSLDSLNRIQLGTEDYTGNRTILFDEWENAGYSEFIIRNTDNSNSLILFNDSTSKGLYYNSFLTGGNDFVELSVGSGQVYISRAIMDGPTQKTQLLIFDTSTENYKTIFRDDINLKGVEYHADYESNFTARSLVTKQYVDSAITTGSLDTGIGLSKSGSTILLGDNTTLFYTDTPTVKDFFLYQVGTNNLASLYSGFGATNPTLSEAGFAATNSAGSRGAEIKVEYNSATPNPFAKIQIDTGTGLSNVFSSDQTTGYRVRDDIHQRGLVNDADYEANFTARSLVTKQYVDNAISGSTGGGHTIKSNGNPLTQRAGLNFSTSFIVTDNSVNNETDVTIDTNIIATRSYVDGITAQYSAATKLYLFNNY